MGESSLDDLSTVAEGTMSILDEWRTSFEGLDNCPWPGPRPLRKGDAALLIGRTEERRAFQRVIKQNRLVLLHGMSGVGKSSLLSAGLIPDMERAGRTVYPNDQWGGAQRGDLVDFLAERLRLPGSGRAALDAVNRESTVLVLDQFEELIRYSRQRTDEVFDLIVDLNQKSAIKIVISFRSEFLHEFTNLQPRLVNFTSSQFTLREVDPAFAEDVIRAGNVKKPDEDLPLAIADPVRLEPEEARPSRGPVESIADVWRRALEPAPAEDLGSESFERIGLLHLQALLYALHFDAAGATIDQSILDQAKVVDPVVAGLTPKDAKAVFRVALQRSVDHKLAHCRAAALGLTDQGTSVLGRTLVEGAHWAVVRSVGHLSSAGYKLIRETSELGDLILGGDLAALRDGVAVSGGPPGERDLDRLFDALFEMAGLGRSAAQATPSDPPTDAAEGAALDVDASLLEIERGAVAASADEKATSESPLLWTERLADDSFDPVGVTSGPMMRLTPTDVLIEEFRRIVFALVWLEESKLVRITTVPGTGAMVSLIHDGFGSALAAWGKAHENDPEGPLSAITAPRGASFGWRPGRAKPDEKAGERKADVGGPGPHRVLPNLVWRGAWIQADLERVVFVNCDLRGLLFDGCRLTGVNFVNCLLDGAIFSDCVIDGDPGYDEDDLWSEDEPTFVVPADAELVADHAAYRGMEHPHATLLSPLPGAPAVPFDGSSGTERLHRGKSEGEVLGRLEAPLATGGVVVHGGRVSNLVVRRSRVLPGSEWRLRHTVGSGLDFVELPEQETVMRIDGSALRHVSISPEVEGADATVTIEVSGSSLSQIWVAPRVNGAIVVRNSTVVHAWNGSPCRQRKTEDEPAVGVAFSLEGDTKYHGLIDIDTDGACTPLGPGSQLVEFERLGADDLRDRQQRMDYRRNPYLTDRTAKGDAAE